MSDGLEIIRNIALRKEIDEAAERWIVRQFSAWWNDGKDPARLSIFLQVPPVSKITIAERDRWLFIAANELPSSEGRAAELQRIAKEFMRTTWPIWRRSSNPPADASPLMAALFFAADSGATMDFGSRQWRNIVRKSVPQ